MDEQPDLKRSTASGISFMDRARSVPPRVALAVGLVGIAAVGLADLFSGDDLQLSLFYLAFIGVVGWTCGTKTAVTVAILAAGVSLVAVLLNADNSRGAAIGITNSAFRLLFFVAFAWGTSVLRATTDELRRRSDVDTLTGLLRRRAFYERVDVARIQAGRSGLPLTMVFLDLDNLKAVNDASGHDAGDDLLRECAALIVTNVREGDAAARIGGDEFALLLPATDSDAAQAVIERLREQFVDHPSGALGASFGVVTWPTPPASSEEMVQRADRLMYVAKSRERGSIEVATIAT
jgi:diguanylate cyclase (GGDEF)-like protein